MRRIRPFMLSVFAPALCVYFVVLIGLTPHAASLASPADGIDPAVLAAAPAPDRTPVLHWGCFPTGPEKCVLDGLKVQPDVAVVLTNGPGSLMPNDRKPTDADLATWTPADWAVFVTNCQSPPTYPVIAKDSPGILYADLEFIDPATENGRRAISNVLAGMKRAYTNRTCAIYGWPRQLHEQWDKPAGAAAVRAQHDSLAWLWQMSDAITCGGYIPPATTPTLAPGVKYKRLTANALEAKRLACQWGTAQGPKPVLDFVMYRYAGSWSIQRMANDDLIACWDAGRNSGCEMVLFEWTENGHRSWEAGFIQQFNQVVPVWAGR